MTRIFPIVIYLGGGEHPERVLSAINEFSNSLGLEPFDYDEPTISSFFQKLWGKTTSKETKKISKRLSTKARRH